MTSRKEQALQLIQFMEGNSAELVYAESKLNVQSAIQGALINNLKKDIDVVRLITAVTALVIRQRDFYNIKGNINDTQAVTIAGDLLEVFGYETLEDIILMFKMARQGTIGEKIWKLDTDTIFNEWVPAYLELKAKEREKMHQQIKSEGVVDLKQSAEMDDKAAQRFAELSEKLKNSKKEVSTQYYGHQNFLRDIEKNAHLMQPEEIDMKLQKAKDLGLDRAVLILENAKRILKMNNLKNKENGKETRNS